ncbi:hypothetical protein E2C01_078949 [Portunus trituberculatus]|uniref:Uncharacterized protein n=1 Tax=Portunus trituberculatus TaxID=210409 RepID=A0A5B7IID8_PORTR|nr:hypothetical protein [Portunus trituberculatus]
MVMDGAARLLNTCILAGEGGEAGGVMGEGGAEGGSDGGVRMTFRVSASEFWLPSSYHQASTSYSTSQHRHIPVVLPHPPAPHKIHLKLH